MAGKIGFVFMALALFALAYADISIDSYQVLPSSLKPGVSGRVVLTVSNPSTGTDATGVQLEATGSSAIISSARVFLGDMKAGTTTTITVPFTVAEGAQSGIYSLPMEFVWFTSDGAGHKNFNVPLTVNNFPLFQVSTEQETVFTDGDFTLQGTLTNAGGKAYEVKLTVNSTSFLPTGPSPLLIGTVEYGSKGFTLPLTLSSDVTSGRHLIPVVLTYRDELGQDQTSALSFTVNVNRRGPDFSASVSSDKPFVAGNSMKIYVKVKNVGTDTAYSVKVSPSASTMLTNLGISEVSLGNIAAGEEKTASFDIGVNQVAPGFYSAPFKVRYENARGEEQAYDSVNSGINIESSNEVSVFVSSKTSPIVMGEANTLSVLVSNVGSSAIKSLSVRIYSDAFEVLDAQDSQYIGGLQEDDFSSVQYKVAVRNVPEGTYNLSVETTFKDSYNMEHKAVTNVPLKIVSAGTAAKFAEAKAGANGNGPIILGIIGVVVLVVSYFAYKKFFSHKKKE